MAGCATWSLHHSYDPGTELTLIAKTDIKQRKGS
jgi:hypothetical protein